MRKALLSISLVMLGLWAGAQVKPVSDAKPETIQLKESSFDFGRIPQGKPVTHIFKVTNTGTTPLVLEDVQASCGCTTPEWSQDPIMPGKTAQLKVGYNTTITGPFTKLIEVFSNDPQNSRSVINIKGTVEAPAQAQGQMMEMKSSEVATAKTAVLQPMQAARAEVAVKAEPAQKATKKAARKAAAK